MKCLEYSKKSVFKSTCLKMMIMLIQHSELESEKEKKIYTQKKVRDRPAKGRATVRTIACLYKI